MKTTARLIFYAGVLITLDCRQLASAGGAGGGKAQGVKEQVPPPRPTFPLLTLPSFSSFSLSALNFPYLQPFSPNRISSAERVRATKTEYVEVTRRQTVHPVCYTAYEAKAPCLPYAQPDFPEDDYDALDSDPVHQAHDSFNLNQVRHAIQSTPTLQAPPSNPVSPPVREDAPDDARSGRYLHLKLRREGAVESSRVEGSEFFPTLNRAPPQQQPTEYHTKTVLITKLEKYTDRRVTATLLAVNCLPADRSIPMCQSYPNPIRETPDRRSDDPRPPADYAPIPSPPDSSQTKTPHPAADPAYSRNKTSESLQANGEETLLGED